MLIVAALLLALVAPGDQGRRIRGVAIPDVVAASCSDNDVATAVSAQVNGGTVRIPAGDCTWDAAVSVPNTKGITIRGAGVGVTIIRVDASLNDNTDRLRLFNIRTAAGNALARLTAMTISSEGLGFVNGVGDQSAGQCTGSCAPVHVWGTGLDRYRIDNIHFSNVKRIGLMVSNSNAANGTPSGHEFSGLTDNNIIECSAVEDTSCTGWVHYSGPAWNNGVSLAANVTAGWGLEFTRPVERETNTAHYVEANEFRFHTFAQNGAIEVYGGGRVVWRYNTHDGPTIGWHGVDSGGHRGTLWGSAYGNTIACTDASAIHWRSGIGVMFGNDYTGTGNCGVVAMATYRARPQQFHSGQGQCDGLSALDGNVGSGTNAGWPCLDQPGWFFGDADGGSAVQMPVYIWDNQLGASEFTVGQAEVDPQYDDTHQCNREWFLYNASFNGASTVNSCATGGVGIGTRAQMDAITSPTNYVGFWVTDEGGNWNTVSGGANDGRLYTASGGSWSVYYTPYTYPHPLKAP